MAPSIRSIVERQISRWYAEQRAAQEAAEDRCTPKPVITVSRQLGSGGAEIAMLTAKRLDCEIIGWRIVNQIAERIEVRREIVHLMDEKTRSLVWNWFNQMRKTPSMDENEYHALLLGTIRSFIELGSVVMLGRGAGFVQTERPKVNVRIIAPMEKRIERVVKRDECSRYEAVAAIDRSDSQRAKFTKRLFGEDWGDALNYDLVINTGTISPVAAATAIETLWLRFVGELEHPTKEREGCNEEP